MQERYLFDLATQPAVPVRSRISWATTSCSGASRPSVDNRATWNVGAGPARYLVFELHPPGVI